MFGGGGRGLAVGLVGHVGHARVHQSTRVLCGACGAGVILVAPGSRGCGRHLGRQLVYAATGNFIQAGSIWEGRYQRRVLSRPVAVAHCGCLYEVFPDRAHPVELEMRFSREQIIKTTRRLREFSDSSRACPGYGYGTSVLKLSSASSSASLGSDYVGRVPIERKLARAGTTGLPQRACYKRISQTCTNNRSQITDHRSQITELYQN